MSFEQLMKKKQLPKQDFYCFTVSTYRKSVCFIMYYVAYRVLVHRELRELSVTIGENTWEDIWSYVNIISPNHRHSFNPLLSPLCLKCKIEIGTLTHCLWSCYELQKYWSDNEVILVCEMKKIFGKDFEMDPVCLMLGLLSRLLTAASSKR